MAVSKVPIFTPGVWGPYYSAMVPGMWLNEGGQSATGKLIDHVIDSHPATPSIKGKIGEMYVLRNLGRRWYSLAFQAYPNLFE
jgi:ribulose kinase